MSDGIVYIIKVSSDGGKTWKDAKSNSATRFRNRTQAVDRLRGMRTRYPQYQFKLVQRKTS